MSVFRPALTAAIVWIAALPAFAADPAPRNDSHRDGAPPVSPLAAQPLERLSNTRDRPLFSPTRRPPAPPPVVAVAPPPPPPPPDVALLGVVMDGEDARAVVRAGPAAKILRVGIGDDIGGWKVGQIEARQLVLLLDGRTATFTMFTGTNAKPASNAGAAQPSSGAPPQNLAQQPQNLAQQPQTASDEPVPASRKRAH
jgi:general secretion pathway protein N